MRRFFVQVDEPTFTKLVDLAVKERRDVRDQAALVLEGALRETNILITSPAACLHLERQAVPA